MDQCQWHINMHIESKDKDRNTHAASEAIFEMFINFQYILECDNGYPDPNHARDQKGGTVVF